MTQFTSGGGIMSYGVKFIMMYLEKHLGKRGARRIVYILLLIFGIEKKIIKQVFGASDTTLAKYSKALRDEAIEKIFEQNSYRPQSELEAYRKEIEQEFEVEPPATRREAAVKIEKLTGIKRSIPRIGKFLKKGG
jgi:transposase